MKIKDKVVVVTGGASGIGRGLCHRFAAEGPKGIVVSDYNAEGAAKVAEEIGGLAVTADVGKEADIRRLVDITSHQYGAIDLFCSNAGIPAAGGAEAPDSVWQRCWDIHVMAHVYAARAVLPSMIERGGGYLLQTGFGRGIANHPWSSALCCQQACRRGVCGMAVDHPCPSGYQSQLPLSFRCNIRDAS